MTWVKLDDDFHLSERSINAGLKGRALFIAGLCWCAKNLTDGHIARTALATLATLAGVPASTARVLVDVGLWLPAEDGGWEVKDYLVYNPTRDVVMAERERAKQRMKGVRSRGRSPARSPERSGEHHPNTPRTSGEQPANFGRTSGEVPAKFGRSSAVPYPIGCNSSSSEIQQGYPQPVDDDEKSGTNDLVTAALALIADRRMAGQTPRNPERYRAAVMQELTSELSGEACRLVGKYPAIDAVRLAAALQGETHSLKYLEVAP